jgi:hypothetical protein
MPRAFARRYTVNFMDRWSPDGRQFALRRERGREAYRDPDDQTGATYDPPIPDQFYWVIVKQNAPGQSGPDVERSGLFSTPEAARDAAEQKKADDPSLAALPIVDAF